MDVYLVPTGPDRYELYCEPPDDPPPVAPDATPTRSTRFFHRLQQRWTLFLQRLQQRFNQMLAAVEREYERERSRPRAHRPRRDTLLGRLRTRGVRWLAERVAEQRLLWRLRGQRRVRAHYPAQLDEARALAAIRRNLQRDADRHSRWLVVDTVGLLLSGLLMPFPGPNLPAYYFTFRVVGHLLAVRGARQGLRRAEWILEPSPALGQLADLTRVPPAERLERVRAIERELGLRRLSRFLERIAVQPA